MFGAVSPILVKGASLFDGRSCVGARDVLIEKDRIAGVDTSITAPGVEIIDARGKTLLPGLIDCHVHTWAEALTTALAFGVTTVIDMFTSVEFMQAMQQADPARADLVSAGNLATAPGGHGTQYGVPIATLTTPAEADDFVKARIDEGSRFLKIIWEPGDGTWPTLNEPTITALIEAAHRHGRLAVIHCTRRALARRAVELGVDGLAHIFGDEPPDEDFGELLASRGVFLVPTLSVIASSFGINSGERLLKDEEFSAYLLPTQIASLRRAAGWSRQGSYENAQHAVALALEAGARVLAGTDAGNPGTTDGASMHRELELLAECGLQPEQALAAATSFAAQAFGLLDRGSVVEGNAADLLLVDGDPSKNLADTRRIAIVMKRGIVFDRSAYAEKVALARERLVLDAPPPEAIASDGLISDFEDGLVSRFGAGWSVTTDAMLGGNSTANIELAESGAGGTSRSLVITGETKEGYLFPWAGTAFNPGQVPMAPANLSLKKGIRFAAKGDGGTYHLGVMATSFGLLPVFRSFLAGTDWESFEFAFDDLGMDGSDVTVIMFVCNDKRSFAFQIDDVALT